MPLPAALLARLQKRGIVKEEEKQGFKKMMPFSEYECKIPRQNKLTEPKIFLYAEHYLFAPFYYFSIHS